MNVNMVTVAIAAVGLVAQQQLRFLGAKYRSKALRRLVEVRPRKPDAARRIWVESGSLAAVAKAFNTVNTENVRAGTQFIHPGIVDLAAHAPIGGRNDNYAMPRR
jgi:imidazolonepropionase-like amidohydrolase